MRLGVEPVSFEDVQHMLNRCPASAPGPDGLRYGHWANAGDDVAQVLCRTCVAILDGHAVPAGYNDGLVVFIPTAPVQPRDATHFALPSQLHPLTLSNTCVNNLLEPMAQRVLHWSQRGVVEGRQMPANVAQVEAAVEEYLDDERAEPAAIVLDIAVAFLSVEWAFMRWALLRLGVPAGLVDAIVRLYGSAFVHIVWEGGASSQSLLVTRGIRQGCPASGTLRALLCGPVVWRAWQS